MAWRPSDLVLHGRFCPPSELFAAVEEVRRHADAKAAIMLVADDRVVLRSFCCFAAAPEKGARRDATSPFTLFLRHLSALDDARGLQDLVRPPRPTGARKRHRFPRSSGQIVERLIDLAHKSGAEPLAVRLKKGRWVPADPGSQPRRAPLGGAAAGSPRRRPRARDRCASGGRLP